VAEPGPGPQGHAPVVAIAGPTASGKTELGLSLALALGGEIVSFDSRQAYRGMEVGTAAPDPEQRAAVPHHGVAFLAPGERYGAGRFARLARAWIGEIRSRGREPILVGGTGFFLRSLARPVFREPPLDPGRRERLGRWLAASDPERVAAWARRVDPALADRLSRLDPQRATRALEVAWLTGRRLSWWQEHGPAEAPQVPIVAFVLELPADAHRSRVAARAERMLARPWRDEVAALRRDAPGRDPPWMKALGYAEVAAWADGRLSREEALARIVRDTWAYARRQRTWFRHQSPPGTVRIDATRPVPDQLRRVRAALEGADAEREG
jgi:tRNA dimethylallyltransferase